MLSAVEALETVEARKPLREAFLRRVEREGRRNELRPREEWLREFAAFVGSCGGGERLWQTR